MRPEDPAASPSPRPNFMAVTTRPAGSGENILARLERGSTGAAVRRAGWTRKAKFAASAAAAATALLACLMIGLTQATYQGQRDVPMIVAQPVPAEPAGVSEPLEAPPFEPASLEPIPVLPMLADVIEKAPAMPAARRPAQVHRTPRHAARSPIKTSPAPVKAAEASVEADVALLSAVLIHAPRHSAERARAQAKCKLDKNCPLTGPLPAMLQATE